MTELHNREEPKSLLGDAYHRYPSEVQKVQSEVAKPQLESPRHRRRQLRWKPGACLPVIPPHHPCG